MITPSKSLSKHLKNRGEVSYIIAPFKEKTPSLLTPQPLQPLKGKDSLNRDFLQLREETSSLVASLEMEDLGFSIEGVTRPLKWYLGYTTWLFEHYLLHPHLNGYKEFHWCFDSIFAGAKLETLQRGKAFSKPSSLDILAYRSYVNEQMLELLHKVPEESFSEVEFLTKMAMNVEAEVQEFILSDLKYGYFSNPIRGGLIEKGERGSSQAGVVLQENRWIELEGGLYNMGYEGEKFAFEDEMARHTVYLNPFAVNERLVTNGEFLDFIEDGGYQRKDLWLEEGWSRIVKEEKRAPLYWIKSGATYEVYTLSGVEKIGVNDPVSHVSFFEADAYAKWADARLLTEGEWEIAFAELGAIGGHFLHNSGLQPRALKSGDLKEGGQILQMRGNVWEWTNSPYTPYPGYSGLNLGWGHLFVMNRMVLRGGSCLTNERFFRETFRKNADPSSTLACAGIRLARDL